MFMIFYRECCCFIICALFFQGLDLSGADVPDDLKALLEEYKEQRKAVCAVNVK